MTIENTTDESDIGNPIVNDRGRNRGFPAFRCRPGQMVEAMKSWKEFSAERVGIMIMLSREGMSQNVVLPWDSNSDELIGAFVKMLWVAGYPPAWFPDILRELAENIEIELGRHEPKFPSDETDSKAE